MCFPLCTDGSVKNNFSVTTSSFSWEMTAWKWNRKWKFSVRFSSINPKSAFDWPLSAHYWSKTHCKSIVREIGCVKKEHHWDDPIEGYTWNDKSKLTLREIRKYKWMEKDIITFCNIKPNGPVPPLLLASHHRFA